ncbi:uncharacterized protein METZ01_LOCUS105494, partial [marine metagenome]
WRTAMPRPSSARWDARPALSSRPTRAQRCVRPSGWLSGTQLLRTPRSRMMSMLSTCSTRFPSSTSPKRS